MNVHRWTDEAGRLDAAVYAALLASSGERGRQAAGNGVAAIAVTSAVVNLALKPLGNRRRPDRRLHEVPVALASLVAYSRVHTGVHHPSDVLAGTVRGSAVVAALGRAGAR